MGAIMILQSGVCDYNRTMCLCHDTVIVYKNLMTNDFDDREHNPQLWIF